ncbi:methyl-accepting chemotaxis protein [Phenylobacterium sp.]|uniref:methyl-accepting chemotaxis protein n=1 Tax=Phenylobacterium sp. TaxID=1871053 RepID=UPI002F953F10
MKLAAAFGAVIVMVIAANGVIFWKVTEAQKFAGLVEFGHARAADIEIVERGLAQQVAATRGFVLAQDGAFRSNYQQQGVAMDAALERFITEHKVAEQRERGKQLRTHLAAWRTEHAERPMALAVDPATRGEAAAMVAMNSLETLEAEIKAVKETQQELLAERRVGQTEAIAAANLVMILGALAAAGFAAAMAWMLSRLVARPVVQMTAAMRRLADGDNTVEVPGVGRGDEIGEMAGAVQTFKDAAIEKLRLEGTTAEQAKAAEEERRRQEAAKAQAAREQQQVVDGVAGGLERLAAGDLMFRLNEPFAQEYEKLRADFNGAMDQLQDTLRTVAANVRGMRSGTEEISQAADDLSKRTEQQAASLEETAAALDEITATVRKTAEGANHAREVVNTARSDAERSGEVVRHAVEAMSEIEKSSSQISQIIGVIDEIAFQTNLLALNAGVEAARAGDAGKGFAVVASEVRALAQRSADAAKEIKTLISASTEQVGQGVALVGETGEALNRIVAQVADITSVVGEIAASAQEQATGLHQVNTAVNQMDQVTQQNAAMVEQSTAASHSVAQEAEELTRLIGRFRLGQDAAAGKAPAPARRTSGSAPAQAPRAALKTVSTHAGGGGALRKSEAAAGVDSWEEF